MGSAVPLNPKSGILVNGHDMLDYHPDDMKSLINSDKTGIIRAIVESNLMDDEDENAIAKPDNYAEHAGRPSLTKVPFGRSESDGYPYLPGHDPLCDGKPYYNGMCKCKYDKWNTPEVRGDYQMWPGGPDMDDFDM